MSGGVIDLTLGYFRRGGSGIAWMLKKTRIDNPLTVLPNRSWLGRHNILRLSMELAAESGDGRRVKTCWSSPNAGRA